MFLLLQPGRTCMKLSKNGQKGECKSGWFRHPDGRRKPESGGTRRQGKKAEKPDSWERSILRNATDLLCCSALLRNSLLKQGWNKHMPFNLRRYRHTSDTRWTLLNASVYNSTRGAFRSHVISWFPENGLRNGRFQCSGRLVWTAAAI